MRLEAIQEDIRKPPRQRWQSDNTSVSSVANQTSVPNRDWEEEKRAGLDYASLNVGRGDFYSH